MSKFKFSDCRDCVYRHHHSQSKECRACDAGENFEERIDDIFDHMTHNDDNGIMDYD